MGFVPKTFMEIVEKGAIGISNNYDANSHTHFSRDEVNKQYVYHDAKYSIANRFCNRSTMIFVTS